MAEPIAYYNEIDPYAAQWLRNLIKDGHIANGVVDERSIEDVKPDELVGYTQCHFFAGIGVWSLALRRAGWSDNRAVWTGSCPCQPFSSAGTGAGFADERHLWPAFHHLIAQCKPAVILGEQVASKAVDHWVDLVQADLEGMAYAFGAVAFPSAGIGAPHIRDRTYWVANAMRARSLPGAHPRIHRKEESGRPRHGESERPGAVGWMADVSCSGRGEERSDAEWSAIGDQAQGLAAGLVDGGSDLRPGPTYGYWRDADWLFCRDGKWRPVEPGTFPLADGSPSRVGRLRAYGNAINAKAAQVFIEAFMGKEVANG